MANILMVVSAANSLTMRDGTEHPTGYWAEELVVSHQTLLDAGHTVHIATPGGRKPTVDEVSLAAESAGGAGPCGQLPGATLSRSTPSCPPRWCWAASTSPTMTPSSCRAATGPWPICTGMPTSAADPLRRQRGCQDHRAVLPRPGRAAERHGRRRRVHLRRTPPHRLHGRGGTGRAPGPIRRGSWRTS